MPGFGDSIKKTSIVVNDGYGFPATRLPCYVMEAAQMVAEGFRPCSWNEQPSGDGRLTSESV